TRREQSTSDSHRARVAPVATTTTSQDLSGTGLNPTGIPGAKSNVPGEQEELAVNQASTSNKEHRETVNFGVSKKVSQKPLPVGKIVKLSAAVLVDGKQEHPLDGTRP